MTKEKLADLISKTNKKAEELEKIGKNSEYIKELSNLALLYIESEEYGLAEKNLLVCLRHFKKQKDRLGQAAVYGILGTLFLKKKSYKNSIDYYNKAKDVYGELNQQSEEIACLMGIGNSLLNMNRLEDASDIFFKTSAICADLKDMGNLLDSLSNLIIIYERLEEWDIVFELYQKTLETFSQIKDKKGMITSYYNLGILKKKSEDFEDALYYFKKGTNIAIDANYAEDIIKGLSYVGESLFYLGKMNESKNQYLKALKLARNVKMENAIIQLRLILNSFGLSDSEIESEFN